MKMSKKEKDARAEIRRIRKNKWGKWSDWERKESISFLGQFVFVRERFGVDKTGGQIMQQQSQTYLDKIDLQELETREKTQLIKKKTRVVTLNYTQRCSDTKETLPLL